MRGEPEAGIEHGAHLLHRIAVTSEEVRDQQRCKAGNATDDVADPGGLFTEPHLNGNACGDRCPADENGGGVEIRDGWVAGKEAARNNGKGVRNKRADHQRTRRSNQALLAEKPAKKAQHENQQIELGGFHEGREAVVEHFEAELFQHRRGFGLE